MAIAGSVIVRIGDASDLTARRTIDATGLVIAPGFIDMHAHSDLQILTAPDHFAKISQGVTTEVLGQDGLSYAPMDDAVLAQVRRQIAGWNGNPADFDFAWRTVGEYLDRLDQGIATNAAYLVPQGTLRLLVVGPDDRPATADEIVRMQEILAESLRAGAVGMSSGLTYTPGMYADTGELAALCEVVAADGGYYCPHTRSYGAGALTAYAEMLDLARSTGCPVHLTHATMNFAENAGRAAEFLALVDAALADGCDISLDTYPYLPGCTTLSALLPSWSSAGGPDALLARLDDPETRERIRVNVEETGSDGCHGVTVDWDTIQISGVGNPALSGMSGTPSRRSHRPRSVPAPRFSSICCARISWRQRSCNTSVTRTTCRRSCSTGCTWAAATGFSSVTGRIPGPGAPSRGTWPGTPGNSDCSVSRTVSRTSPVGRPPGSSSPSAAWSARDTRPTWCSSTPTGSPTPPPSPSPGSRRPESTTSW